MILMISGHVQVHVVGMKGGKTNALFAFPSVANFFFVFYD